MRTIGLAIAAAAVLSSAPAAQKPQFRTSSDLVEVYATAMARNGAGVHDLRGDEFELFEDGKRRDITVFSTMVQPLSVALVLDHSGSTAAEFVQVLQATGEFVGRLFKEDRASLGTLTWDCAPFTSDRATLVDVLQRSLPRDDGSPIWAAADRAMTALVPEAGRHVILLLSDGADNQEEIVNSRAGQTRPPRDGPPACTRGDTSVLKALRDVMDRAERDTVMVYAVAVPSGDPSGGVAVGGSGSMGGAWSTPQPNPPLAEHVPRADLTKLARRSGGSVHELSDYAQLKAAFKVIADELHLQYLLGFVPTKFDGKRHDISVRVTRPGVTIRARESYRAQTK